MKRLISTTNISKEEWLKKRRLGVCGSDAPVIMGVSRFRSVLELWKDKTGQIDIENTESEYAYFGHVMEPIIKAEFTKRTGLKVRAKNQIVQSEEYDFLLADFDGIVKEKDGNYSIFEAKTATEFKRKEWEQGVPEEYLPQIMHYLMVSGYQKAYVCAVVGGNTFFCHEVYRDDEYIRRLLAKELEFWECVNKRICPIPDGSKATVEYLNEIYPISNKKEIQFPSGAATLVASFFCVEEQIKRLTEEKNGITNQLKNLMQDNEKGYVGDHVVSWTTVNKRTLDTNRVKELLGSKYDDYLITSSYRKFSVA